MEEALPLNLLIRLLQQTAKESLRYEAQLKEKGFFIEASAGYAQYHYWCKTRLGLFGELQATYASSTNLTPSNEHGEVGLTLGGTFALTDRLGLILHYGYIGYSGDHYGRDQGACWNGGDFIVDVDWRRLLLGVQFIF